MLYFVTSNQNKIDVARHFLTPLGIDFEPHSLELAEIQSHSIEDIAIHKAKQAFDKLQKPLIVSDHGWSITALNGFPGAYMKYMNEWLKPEDFLNLMKDKENREVFLTEVTCYIDEKEIKVFTDKHAGKFLYEAQGHGLPATTVISISDDVSIAKKLEKNPSAISERPIWTEFAMWYKNRS